ncbi:TPA: response regulator [Klebsiella pneumoniae]|uniref:Response regulator n=3 Tax=Klebsiella pneumoniae TaxID=573 RepID=A0A483MKQ1_KLEPN|nr:response regulator [Klebsiella pneumoniae]MCM6310600.1 response regulator [Klebsiella pneumoniae]MCR1017010.1 response regulator [Klebsiella pneumoniae]MCR1031503.1 response regulator [Klebsiella pneumoniae]MDZ1837794.1 response regulator [Klebsiella pneumoniae]MDZ1970378.1 response regulator [Klebsiella pneumoniae]
MEPEKFAETAIGFTKSPLGIIALFIVLVYGFASFVVGFGNGLSEHIAPLIYFMVFFPVIVFLGFLWLVAKHHNKLYGPSDFKYENNFLRAQIATAASLTAATAKQPENSAGVTESQLRKIVNVVSNAKRQSKHEKWRNRILWVDDRPENNVYERQAFEAQGIEFALALSTDEALELLKTNKFAAIISDMDRKEGAQEGYVLLERLRAMGDKTPFMIYASSDLPEHKRMARERGAIGSTNRAEELFQIVMGAITNGS